MNKRKKYSIGVNPCIELIKNHSDKIINVFISSNFSKKDKFKEIQLLLKNNVEINIDDKIIRSISDKENSDIIIEFYEYECKINTNNRILIIENECDEGAIGTIIRTALAFNFKDIIFVNETPIDIFDSYIIRASMGAIFSSNVIYLKDINEININNNLLIKKSNDLTLPFQIVVAQILYKESIK